VQRVLRDEVNAAPTVEYTSKLVCQLAESEKSRRVPRLEFDEQVYVAFGALLAPRG
jgi:hypothetical protein